MKQIPNAVKLDSTSKASYRHNKLIKELEGDQHSLINSKV